MFFLLIGTRGFERLVAVLRARCPNCGVEAPQRYWERGTRLTLFLIPVLPLSKRNVRECTNCGWATRVSTAEVDSARSRSRSGPVGAGWG
jgi:Zn ribbon nucleic-acid-binding protein